MNKYRILLLIILIYSHVFAQEPVMLVVLKGSVLLSQNNKTIKIEKSDRVKIINTAKVTFNKNSIVLVYNKNSRIEYVNKNIILTGSKINSDLLDAPKQTLAGNFVSYLDRMYKDIEEEASSTGASVGAVYRLSNSNQLFFEPQNGAIILSDTLNIKFLNNKTQFISNLIIKNIQTNYIVYDKKCNSLIEKVIGLSSGNYNWCIKFIIDSKITEQSCSFIIPSIQEKNTILEEINDFKMNLNDCSKQQICLSEESKNIFLNDFLISKGYYF